MLKIRTVKWRDSGADFIAMDRGRSPYFFETKRRERLGNQLAEISRDLAQRRIVIPAAPNVAYRELSGLPSTIRIGPASWRLPASTRRTRSASSWNSCRPVAVRWCS